MAAARTIRIDDAVMARLVQLGQPGESPNAVIRRVLGLAPSQARRGTALDRRRPQ